MGLSKTEYAKYQFMILVLEALKILILQTAGSGHFDTLKEIVDHEVFIQDLMKEE